MRRYRADRNRFQRRGRIYGRSPAPSNPIQLPPMPDHRAPAHPVDWTCESPRAAGYYWLRVSRHRPQPVRVDGRQFAACLLDGEWEGVGRVSRLSIGDRSEWAPCEYPDPVPESATSDLPTIPGYYWMCRDDLSPQVIEVYDGRTSPYREVDLMARHLEAGNWAVIGRLEPLVAGVEVAWCPCAYPEAFPPPDFRKRGAP